MTNGSIAPTNNSPQDLALQARLSVHVRRIATEIYRFDRGSVDVHLEDLAPEHQQAYIKAATAAAFLSNQDLLRPALYDAADQLVIGGIGNLPRPLRAGVVRSFIRAWQVMHDHLCGLRHPETLELMRVLATQDASIASAGPAAPVTDARVDLAKVEITTGVQ